MLSLSWFEERHGEVLDNWIGLRFVNSCGTHLDKWDAHRNFNPYYVKNNDSLGLMACPIYEATHIFGFDKIMGTNIITNVKRDSFKKTSVIITFEEYDERSMIGSDWARVIKEKDFRYILGNMNEDYAKMVNEGIVLEVPRIDGSIRRGHYQIIGYRNDVWSFDKYPRHAQAGWYVEGAIVHQDEDHITIVNSETGYHETYLVNWSSNDKRGQNDLFDDTDYTSWMGLNIRPIFFPNR